MKTNSPYAPDLREVINLFVPEAGFEASHRFETDGGVWLNRVEIGDELYEFSEPEPQCADALERKRLEKRCVKLCLYRALEKHFARSMPWGALTGIRPTKLAYAELAAGRDFRPLFAKMGVSERKTALISRIIENQRGVYDTRAGNADFFVFVPFCASRCRYCSFVTADMARYGSLAEDYVSALEKEIAAAKSLAANFRSVYIGGGTPVALPSPLFARMLDAIGAPHSEYTVEAGRPDCITPENVGLMLEHGVTRVCVNPQTFNDATLARLGRRHTAADVIEKYDLVKDKFDVNMDLIAGLEGETFADFAKSIDTAISLAPENITVHTLCLKRGAELKESVDYLSAGEVEEMVEYAHRALAAAGYSPYYLYRQKYMAGNLENTGYALPGKQCVYNVDIMEETADIIACGANSVSKAVENGGARIERYKSPKDVPTYLAKTEEIIRKKEKLFSDMSAR